MTRKGSSMILIGLSFSSFFFLYFFFRDDEVPFWCTSTFFAPVAVDVSGCSAVNVVASGRSPLGEATGAVLDRDSFS